MSMNTQIYKLNWDQYSGIKTKTEIETSLVHLEVDGSVNKNPGTFGIVGIYNPNNQNIIAYKYRGNRLTNQLMEMMAIYHGLETFKMYKTNNNPYIIVSDSLTTINILSGAQNVRNKRLAYIKELIEELLQDDVLYLVYRRGHIPQDYVGKYITNLVKYYNRTQKEPDIEVGSLQDLIDQYLW